MTSADTHLDATGSPNRRIVMGAAVAALSMTAGSALAQVHSHPAPPPAAGKAAAKNAQAEKSAPASDEHAGHGTREAIAATSKACIAKGEACLKHCIALLNKGDTSLVDCLKTVTAMIPICRALERYAVIDARHLTTLARLTVTVNTDCETECRKHAAHHVTCKDCAEACAACIKACNALGG